MYFYSFICISQFLCVCELLSLYFIWFEPLVKAFVTDSVLMSLTSTVLDLDSNNTYTASASFQWLSLFTSGGLDSLP